jgi:hypothetical protein
VQPVAAYLIATGQESKISAMARLMARSLDRAKLSTVRRCPG